MNLDLGTRAITLVIAPYDMRAGFATLSRIARLELGIDVGAGKDAVVFLSKRREICKIIMADESGATLITRRLHAGRFKKLVARLEDPMLAELSEEELLRYLDGEAVAVRKEPTF